MDLVNLFSGGALLQLSIFALGIMPYITSSIILQMLQDLALHCGAFHYRCADFNLTVVVCEQDFVETYGRIFFALKTVDIKFPTFFSFKLLTCNLYYNVHLSRLCI